MGLQGAQELLESQELEVAVLAGGDQIVGKEHGGFIGGDTAVLLHPLFLVDALLPEAVQELLARLITLSLFVNTLDQTLGDSGLQRDGMQAPVHGIAVFQNVTNDLVEDGTCTAVSGHDRESTAPSGD